MGFDANQLSPGTARTLWSPGYRGLANIAVAIERDLFGRRQNVTHTRTKEDVAALAV